MNRNTHHVLSLALVLGLCACDYVPSWMGGAPKAVERVPGERISALIDTPNIQPDPSVQALPVTVPAEHPRSESTQATGGLTAETGNVQFSGTLEREQSVTIGEGESFEHPLAPRPVVAAGVVYAMDAIGAISAHDAARIDTVIWRGAGVSEKNEPLVMGGGLAYAEGRLYAASGRGVVAALDAKTGQAIWTKSLRLPLRSAPVVSGSALYLIAATSQTIALSAETGEVLWVHRGMAETATMMNAVSPVITGNLVIAPYASGEIVALNAQDGQALWSESLASGSRTLASAVLAGIGGDPVVDGEVVIAVSSGGKLGALALETGQKAWTAPINSVNTPWLAGDFLYVLTTDHQLLCLVKYSGQVRWAVSLPSYENEAKKKDPIVWRGPVMIAGKLALVGTHGELRLMSAQTGETLRMIEIPEEMATTPIPTSQALYAVGADATLIALQ